MGTGGLSWRSFAIQNWSRSNRRSHRRTRWASGASCLQSKASTTLSVACAPTAPNSSARWPSTRTSTDSVTCEALRAPSSRWPRNSSEAFTAFGETGGAQALLRLDPMARNHPAFSPTCAAVLLGALNAFRLGSFANFVHCCANFYVCPCRVALLLILVGNREAGSEAAQALPKDACRLWIEA